MKEEITIFEVISFPEQRKEAERAGKLPYRRFVMLSGDCIN